MGTLMKTRIKSQDLLDFNSTEVRTLLKKLDSLNDELEKANSYNEALGKNIIYN